MKVSVLQWNILYEEKIHNIEKFLLKNKTDIICLQELTLDSPIQDYLDTPKLIADVLGYHYYHHEISLKTPKVGKLALGIFTKFPILKSRHVVLQKPSGVGGYGDELRLYIESKLKIGSKTITVGTTHLSFTKFFINNAKRQRESNKLLTAIKPNSQRFILTGDLNSSPNSYTIRNLKKYLKHAGPDYHQKTFTTKPFTVENFSEDGLNWRLDYIFTTKDIKVLSSQILNTQYSDHLPILAILDI